MGLTLQSFPAVAEAGAALTAADSRYLGGGTLAVRATNEGDVSFSTLVRVTDPTLGEISVNGSQAHIGASVTMSAITRHPDLAAIAPAARAVGGPAVRNMATVGGNLFAPAPYGDFAVALLALDATVHFSDGTQPIEAFLAIREMLPRGRIVTAVSFTLPPPGTFRFRKVSRVKPKGVSVLTIAAVIGEKDGAISSARIALGCLADRPMRAKAAERALAGKPRTSQGIADALKVSGDGTSPITDAIASGWYRAEVLPVHLKRLLLE
ncbi:MAG: FAD binding domain-containing protein [Mesorhizobium sp.]|nr:FAD binding domain-containing protein [Mesorhizobium sp.]